MANIQGGALEFDVLLKTGQINSMLEETKRRVQGFSDATVAGGAQMDAAYQSTAQHLTQAFEKIGQGINLNQTAINELEKKYKELSVVAAEAFQKGNFDKYNQISGQGGQLSAIQKEIAERKKVVAELEKADAELVKYNKDFEDNKNKVDNASNAHVRFRTQLMNVKQQMMELEQAGKKNTAEYARLVEEATRLANAMYAANQQIKNLTTTKGVMLQGFVSGLSGVSGAFTAANGAIGLFATKNEELQKIMLKVQSLMSITMGLQAVSATLHETSAFRTGLVAKATQWWASVTAKANAALLALTAEGRALALADEKLAAAHAKVAAATAIVEKQETKRGTASAAAYARLDAAQQKLIKTQIMHTAATEAQNKAATKATVANTGLAGSFRLIGTAIKSIPTFGWLIVGISALIAVYALLSGKAKEAKKTFEEFNKAVSEGASKQIASLMKLSAQWTKLGDNLEAKERFLKNNAAEIKNLTGEQLNLNQADELFIKNTRNYIEALILRAKAKAKQEQYEKKIQEISQKEEEYKEIRGDYNKTSFTKEEIKQMTKLPAEINQARAEAEKLLKESLDFTEAEKKIIAKFSNSTNEILEGSIAKLKEDISTLQKEYDNATDEMTRTSKAEEIRKKQDELSKIDILNADKKQDKKQNKKDPFTEQLEKAKKSYQEYYKMINAGMGKEASQAFPELLKGGDSYKEYLQNQRKIILEEADKTQKELSKTQKEKLHKLNAEIASETNKTIINEFQKGLQTEMNNAKSILDLIELIKKKRKEIEAGDDPLKQQKLEILTKESEGADKRAEDETRNLLKSYSDYLDEKINFELQYGDRKKKIQESIAKAEKELLDSGLANIGEGLTDEQEKRLDSLISKIKSANAELAGLENDRKKYERQTGDEDYDKLIQEYRSFEQKKTDITTEFNEKRKLLNDRMNSSSTTEKERMEAMIALQQLEEEFQKEISGLAVDELTNSKSWTKLFDNLDDLTTMEIENLIKDIETQFGNLSVQFNPVDLETIKEKLNEAKDVVTQRNPFKALVQSIQEYSKTEDDASKRNALKNMFKNASSSLNMLSQGFKSVVNGIKEMGVEMDESTAEMLNNINEMMDAAAKLAEGIASKNPLAILEGSISIIKSGIGILDSGAKRRNRQLAEEYEYYNTLSDTFDMLIEKQQKLLAQKSGKDALSAYQDALGMVEAKITASRTGLESWFSAGASMFSHSNWYNYDKDLGNILNRQQLLTMSAKEWYEWIGANAEGWARLPQEVKDYAESVMEAEEQIESLTESTQEYITGISFNELTSGIMDLVSQTDLAFSDISDSFYENMKKSVMRLIQTKTLGTQIETWYKNLTEDLADGLTNDEVERRRKEYEEIIRKGQEEYDAMIKVMGDDFNNATINSLSGAIKGASQESIDILTGATNAVRDNQVKSVEILRNSLIQLTMINANTNKANQYLEQIEKNTTPTDPLRAAGLTG
jgi:hypothetical protein